ncbi:MAG: zinc-dependent metalloprotease [Myxococcota bacterium]
MRKLTYNMAQTPGGRFMRHSVKAVLPMLTLLVVSCAQDLGTIDRVQHNPVAKRDILFHEDGTRKEWFVQVTTIEAPYASAYSFVGDQGPMERGVFEIQEGVLYFYRSYSFAENEWVGNPRTDVDQRLTNEDGSPYLIDGKEVWTSKNTPLLAYPITSHMDIIWEYNPNTGEKTNVRVENTTDRMWYEREYMRVTWGNNLMVSWAGFTTAMRVGGTYAGNLGVPTIHHDLSAHKETAPRMNQKEGYMDFVNDWTLTAQTEELEGYGTIPLCWFYAWYSGGVYECISEKIQTRTSFLAVDIEREAEYEPLHYDDFEMNRFGYFREERLVWDKDYGFTYDGVRKMVNRHDIFKKDENGKIIGVKPVIYHLNIGYPNDLIDEANGLAAEWSRAFDAAVKAATGKLPYELPAYHANGQPMLKDDGSAVHVASMFIVCENNRQDFEARDAGTVVADETICGSLDDYKPLGDLRYNFLSAITAPTQVGLYGYGPSSVNPLSGRIVKAAANNYVAAMRLGARRALDRLELLAGVKSFREVADGAYIAQDVRNKSLERTTYFKPGYTREEAVELAQKLVPPEVQSALTGGAIGKTDRNPTAGRMGMLAANPDIEAMLISDDVRMLFKDPRLGAANSGAVSGPGGAYALRHWANAKGVQERIKAMTEQTKMGLDKADYYDGAILRLADEYKAQYDKALCEGLRNVQNTAFDFSAFNDSNPCSTKALIGQLREAFAYYSQMSPYAYERSVIPTPLEMETFEPILVESQKAMNGLLDKLRQEFAQELYKRIYWGVAIHEVGHTLGLRHNFEASTDALNFPQEYWQLRVTKNGDKYEPVGLWGETKTQVAAGLREYQYSSVMDYYAKFNMPWLGIGLYDIAAIKYAYARTVEVFEKNPDLTKFAKYIDIDPREVSSDNLPAFKERGEGFGLALRRVHATNYPNFWGNVDDIYKRRDVPISEVIGAKCATEGASCGDGKVCKLFYEGLRCSPKDLTMVPYRFGGDELTFGLPTVAVWDDGVDSFEIVNNLRETYENNWIFAGYWHQDPTYWPTNYGNWVQMNFYQMRNHFQWWAINYSVYNKNDYWKNRFGMRWEEDLNGGLPGAMAAHMSFNVMASTFGRPEPANYGYNWMTMRYEPVDQVNRNNYTTQFMLLEEQGARPIYANWDYNGYQPVVTASGSIYERLAAFQMLADPETRFMAQDYMADSRKFLVNYASVFRNEVRELFGGLMANNSEKYGWCVLTHPTSRQPIAFADRDFSGLGYNGQNCTNSYRGCFTMDGANPVKLTKTIAYDDTGETCANGEQLYDLAGISLEPEPMYTFPTTRFRIPMLAAYYGMALLVDNYDRSFMDSVRLWIAGDKYQITPPPDAEVATCEDLFSGRIYKTYRMKDGGYYPAYDLVSQCDFLFSCYDPARNGSLTDEEVKECKAYARGTTRVNELTLEDLANDYLFHPLQFLIGKLELIRAMHSTYEWGSSNYSYDGSEG